MNNYDTFFYTILILILVVPIAVFVIDEIGLLRFSKFLKLILSKINTIFSTLRTILSAYVTPGSLIPISLIFGLFLIIFQLNEINRNLHEIKGNTYRTYTTNKKDLFGHDTLLQDIHTVNISEDLATVITLQRAILSRLP